jgi:hypothetical protein
LCFESVSSLSFVRIFVLQCSREEKYLHPTPCPTRLGRGTESFFCPGTVLTANFVGPYLLHTNSVGDARVLKLKRRKSSFQRHPLHRCMPKIFPQNRKKSSGSWSFSLFKFWVILSRFLASFSLTLATACPHKGVRNLPIETSFRSTGCSC